VSSSAKISVVIPVRNGRHRIETEVRRTVATLAELGIERWEVLIVDDGSSDGTFAVLQELAGDSVRIRLARHSRPRGYEAAGQTGLEKSTGDLVFIQETETPFRLEDFRRLLGLSEDRSIVAARSASTPRPVAGELVRRLRASGTDADLRIDPDDDSPSASLQLVRRPHLQTLAGPHGPRYRLSCETYHESSFEPAH
jgi:glycosyltransferase involved in cell wall biosynthesis